MSATKVFEQQSPKNSWHSRADRFARNLGLIPAEGDDGKTGSNTTDKPAFRSLTREEMATPTTKYWAGRKPTQKQALFLSMSDVKEVFFGGAAGGGKSEALLMAALQYVHIPDYSALIIRRTFADLNLPGAIMDRAKDWLLPSDARWRDSEKRWYFPSGATLTFGYMEHDSDKYRYQGAELQFIGFDELTQFEESTYRYMFSRLRKLQDSLVPLRMRSASNPGGRGHEWVYQRFIVEESVEAGRVFVPAKLEDNPYLDQEAYLASLMELDPITRQQLREGDWSARQKGNKFDPQWFPIIDVAPAWKTMKKVRYWDLAATEAKPGTDPDWTVGALLGEKDGEYFLLNIRRIRATPKGVEDLIAQTAEIDGPEVAIYMEEEAGASGKNTIDHYRRNVLKGYAFWGDRATGSKEERANPVSAAAEAGNIKLVRRSERYGQSTWISTMLDEFASFPLGAHDDQVDAVSGALSRLGKRARGPMRIEWIA